MSKLKIGMAGLLSAALGFFVQSCTTPEPKPECTVINATPYFAKLTKSGEPAGACGGIEAKSSDLQAVEVGLQRFASPGDTSFTMYARIDYLVYLAQGGIYTCDDDLTNDCANTKAPGKCVACIASGTGATAKFKDGGAAADTVPGDDGGVQGIVYATTDAGVVRVSLTNVCKITEEDVAFTSTADADFKGIDTRLTSGQYANSDSVCSLTPATTAGGPGGSVILDPYTCADGTAYPGGLIKADWSNVEVINSTKAPSNYFTGKLAFTEGTCVSNYDVQAFWPVVGCDDGTGAPDDNLCSPVADEDAGIAASGISPYLKPKCNADLLICVPTATTAELKD